MNSFVETRLFTRRVGDYLSEAEYAELQSALAHNPQLGVVISGSGGIRKMRWAQRGQGKRGGLRVIYYLETQPGVIWMLTIYAKSEATDISPAVLRKIREEIDG